VRQRPDRITADADDLADLDALVAREAEAQNTAAKHEVLAISRVALDAAPRPQAASWRDAESFLRGKSHRHTPSGSLRDAINFAHRFRCVTCGRHRSELAPGQDLQLAHAL
jgi:hypothetical protein